MKRDKGSIGIFVLIALLFMSGFLLILFASNVNKSKIVKEQFNTISDIYAYNGGEEGAYEKAYTDLRKKNKQPMTASSEGQENTAVLELNRTFNENLINYRIYGNGTTKLLPETYQQVEYIESTGTQYIDTGFVPDSNTSIVMMASNTSSSNACLYCARGTSGYRDNTYSAFLIAGNTLRIDYNKTQYGNIMTAAKDIPYVYMQNKNYIYVNGELVKTLTESEFSSEYNMYLMASHQGGTNIGNIGEVKLYYCKIWNNGILAREFIPCYRKSDNVVGMYDVVNNVFYTNNGTGNFNMGDILNEDVVGDEVINTVDTNYGKYQISIRITGQDGKSLTTDLFLKQALGANEYIDYKLGKVVRIDGTEETIDLPQLELYEDYTEIEVLTDVAPSKIEVEYVGYTLD